LSTASKYSKKPISPPYIVNALGRKCVSFLHGRTPYHPGVAWWIYCRGAQAKTFLLLRSIRSGDNLHLVPGSGSRHFPPHGHGPLSEHQNNRQGSELWKKIVDRKIL
ncbi:unnamed protein product, partial [Ectocarpus sp. 12 AP-2014]